MRFFVELASDCLEGVGMKSVAVVFSFVISAVASLVAAPQGDVDSLEPGLVGREDVVLFGGFEEAFANNEWQSNWGVPWFQREGEVTLVDGGVGGGKAMRVEYGQGAVGPGEMGAQFPIVFERLAGDGPGYYDSVYLRYYVKFEEGFDFGVG